MASERVNRLLRLITLLQSRTPRTANDLARELDVSRRTVFRDLNSLGAAGVPCRHVEGQGYRIDKSFYLPPISLSAPEILGLMQLAKATGAQRSRPLHASALSAIYKLISTVPDPIRGACAEMMANVTVNPGAQVDGSAESDHYNTLHKCIAQQTPCTVHYTSPVESGEITFELEPYTLHHANRAWYVLGKTDIHNEVRVLKLVRIAEIELLKRRFTRPKGFSVAQKLGNAWQLIPEGKDYKIELEFTPKVATNVSEVKWHHSQEHEMLVDGRCVMQFEVDGLTEIAWWLCGYADQVKVRKPKALADRVAQMHAQAAAQYKGKGK